MDAARTGTPSGAGAADVVSGRDAEALIVSADPGADVRAGSISGPRSVHAPQSGSTETVRERAKKGSLLWLLDRTQTSMGGRLLRRWIDKPLMNKRAIEGRLEAVETLYHHMIWREDIREQLHQVYDLERLVSRIAFGTANGRDLIALKHSLERVPGLKRCCAETDSATLRERCPAWTTARISWHGSIAPSSRNRPCRYETAASSRRVMTRIWTSCGKRA